MSTEPNEPSRHTGVDAVPHDPINQPTHSATPPQSPQGGVYVPSELDGGTTPIAADADEGATASAEETGQDGDPTQEKKKKGLAWS